MLTALVQATVETETGRQQAAGGGGARPGGGEGGRAEEEDEARAQFRRRRGHSEEDGVLAKENPVDADEVVGEVLGEFSQQNLGQHQELLVLHGVQQTPSLSKSTSHHHWALKLKYR